MDYGALIDSYSSAHTSQGHTQSPICFSPSRYSRQILTSTFVHCNCCLQDLSIIQSITCKMCALLSQKLLFPSYCDIAWWNKMVKLWGSLLASPSVRVLKLHYVSLLAFFFSPRRKYHLNILLVAQLCQPIGCRNGLLEMTGQAMETS